MRLPLPVSLARIPWHGQHAAKAGSGGAPGDLPIEQATKFELVALGLTTTASVRQRADTIIGR